jgi:hypothetical protein
MPRGVVGFEVDPRCLLAAVDRILDRALIGHHVYIHVEPAPTATLLSFVKQ